MEIRCKAIGASLSSVFLCSCAELGTSATNIGLRPFPLALSAEQKVITAQPQSKKGKLPSVYCAEPGREAFTAGTSTLDILPNRQQESSVSGFAAQSEFVGDAAIRASTVQLLRDAMYRMCEGYAAGVISAANCTVIQRRLQNTISALIATQQLTGTIRPPVMQWCPQDQDQEHIQNLCYLPCYRRCNLSNTDLY
jgi:hypothetical protein